MAVDDEVSGALHGQRVDRAVFAARCAERMVQVFTGLREGDEDRRADVDAAIIAMDDLWQVGLSRDVFLVHLEKIVGFAEMAPSDEELEGVRDVYSAYSVLALRYALRYRASGDVEDVIRCAHANLTAMGQLDANIANGNFFEEEQRIELESVRAGEGGISATEMRTADQAVSRARLNAIRNRLVI
ncbi:hypothetical protein [Kibdelosporangium persicum]|uniref:hypothetical protein n=1 Tax=Kibdelosporangium persicum TaxID=2698649 RepID=UPI001565A5AC|nr:hypothetical protein [Kibdelosporangium persicum]